MYVLKLLRKKKKNKTKQSKKKKNHENIKLLINDEASDPYSCPVLLN